MEGEGDEEGIVAITFKNRIVQLGFETAASFNLMEGEVLSCNEEKG
jgi:hypothetical protein